MNSLEPTYRQGSYRPPFETEELERAIERDPKFTPFNLHRLKSVASTLFNPDSYIIGGDRKQLITENYRGLDLERHGAQNLPSDLKLLTHFFKIAISNVKNLTKEKTDRVLFIGEGPGRTSIAAIELSKKLGIKEIWFNDLIPGHIDELREKIRSVYGNDEKVDNVKITYKTGDILEIGDQIDKRFDAIFAMWFVTSEIADFSSIEALRKTREKLYTTINNLLSKQGVFIEDVPYSEGIGTFYYLLRAKTHYILKKLGILNTDKDGNPAIENSQMLLTDYSDDQHTGYPYHIRYAPTNGTRRKQMKNFEESEVEITTQPIGIKGDITRFQNELSQQKIQSLFENTELDDLEKELSKLELDLTNPASKTHPRSKRKKTILWRKKY